MRLKILCETPDTRPAYEVRRPEGFGLWSGYVRPIDITPRYYA